MDTLFLCDFRKVGTDELRDIYNLQLHIEGNIEAGFITSPMPEVLGEFLGHAAKEFKDREPEEAQDMAEQSERARKMIRGVAAELEGPNLGPLLRAALEKIDREQHGDSLTVNDSEVMLVIHLLTEAGIPAQAQQWGARESELTDIILNPSDLEAAKELLTKNQVPFG